MNFFFQTFPPLRLLFFVPKEGKLLHEESEVENRKIKEKDFLQLKSPKVKTLANSISFENSSYLNCFHHFSCALRFKNHKL